MPNEIINCTEKPVKKNHVAYYTKPNTEIPTSIDLYEVCEVFYPHPAAPNAALFPRIETHKVKTFSVGVFGNSSVHMFNLALNSLREMMSVINGV